MLLALVLAMSLLAMVGYPASAAPGIHPEVRAGFACAKLGDHKCALWHYNKAIKSGRLDPTQEAHALALRADAYMLTHYFAKAKADYDKSLAIYCDDLPPKQMALLLSKRGRALMAMGRYRPAIKDLDRAIKLNPFSALTYFRRGNVLRLQGKYRRAAQDFTRAISISPNHRTYYRRSQAYTHLGMIPEAIADLEIAIKLRPDKPNYQARLGYLKSLLKK